MIKLISTDLDGTLLDPMKNLPPDFPEVFERLQRNNIRFVASSGRSYQAVRPIFREMTDRMSFICDNGAFVISGDKATHINPISCADLNRIIKVCSESLHNVYPVLCGLNGTYVSPEVFRKNDKELGFYYFMRTECENPADVDDQIMKVAIYDPDNPSVNSYPVLNSILGEEMTLVVSGDLWMDIMNKGIDKGRALSQIQEEYGISKEETMAFGDFYNDIPILERAKYSYVMENANDDMKKHGKYIAACNSEYGVTKAIINYLDSHGLN